MVPGAQLRDLSAQRERSQLPAEVTGFVGRKAELARVGAMLESSRLVTVFGAPGVGKTRLALRAGAAARDRYPDGACMVELSLAAGPRQLAAAVAASLGQPGPDGAAQPDAALACLRDQRLLLILDTCEHLVDACAAFVERVLQEAPGVTLLATSRQPLDVPGEHTFLVPPLPVPDGGEAAGGGAVTSGGAVELFAQRAAAAVPGFRVTTDNRADVVRLCQRLDGLPLAIELAAVRLRALPLSELTQRLENPFHVLTSGRRGAVPRHQTLRAAVEWSHDLCSPAERQLWARLSAFAGGFGLDAAHEVCADPGIPREETITTLAALVDKSIAARDSPDGTRYRLPGTLREFGMGQLAASGGDEEALDRLLARYLRLARRLDAQLLDGDQPALCCELRSEHASICAALRHSLDGYPGHRDRERRGGDLATALRHYWMASGLLADGRHWLGKALDRFTGPSPQRARALAVRGRLATIAGDVPAALADIQEGARLAAELDDQPLLARCQAYLSLALAFAGRYEEGVAAGEQAARLMEELGDRTGVIALQPQLAHLHQLAGDLDRCVEVCAAGSRMLAGSGEHPSERRVLSYLHLVAGLALFQQSGRQAESAAKVRAALRATHELGDPVGMACALEALAWLAAREGRPERAAWLLGAAGPLWAQAGSRLTVAGLLGEFHQDAERAARESLGDKRYAALATAGSRRPLALVIGHAIADTDELRAQEPGGMAGPASAGGGLTSREHEIAAAVASGLSNREIAARLYISKRTVDAHVEHIFSKLGISSRVQLTVWLRDRLPDGRTADPAPAARGLTAVQTT
jgi:predicted ATPase/DNA-binding CsgD family transcriptional regulator